MTMYDSDMYPVQLDIDYPDEPRNRVTTLFRPILMIPILVLAAVLGSAMVLPVVFMVLFRKKYPRWWFDFNLELRRFNARLGAYILLLRDEYPSTDEEQAVSLEIAYPDAGGQLNRVMPIFKWILAIPHYIVLAVLGIVTLVVAVIAWFSILIVGRYPRGLFEFTLGVLRWGERVTAYAFLMTTDRYPPFRLGA